MYFIEGSQCQWAVLSRSSATIAAVTVLLVNSFDLAAATIRIPQDHQTIQAGIDAASAADVILVAAGIYNERIQL